MSSWFIRIFKKNKKSKKPSQRIQYNSSDEDHHRSIIPKPKLLNTDMLKSQFNSRFVDIKEYKRVLEKISAQMKNTLDENRKLNDRNTALEKENCFLRVRLSHHHHYHIIIIIIIIIVIISSSSLSLSSLSLSLSLSSLSLSLLSLLPQLLSVLLSSLLLLLLLLLSLLS